MMISFIAAVVSATGAFGQAAAPATQPGMANPPVFLTPLPVFPGAKVVTLWPPGSPMLKPLAGYDKPENFNMRRGSPGVVESVTNIHNPSIELHLAPPDKANGMAIIVAAGGGNNTCNLGTEGTDIATWLNSIGVSAFVERYRLKPYNSATDALADTQQCFRLVRANAKEWNIDPKRVGIMGFSAGGEQSARVAIHFDNGDPSAADPVARQSDRPDFTVLVYAGWVVNGLDLQNTPKNGPPAFCTVAGVDDMYHATQTIDFVSAWLKAGIPTELHIYGHGGHANGIKPRGGIPFGTWQNRFVEWVTDLGMMKPLAK
jgi:endo-1,4-beta-xylanase